MNTFPIVVSEQFFDAVSAASPDDIEFRSKPLRVHAMEAVRRTGFTPVRIRGVAVPEELKAVYLHEEGLNGSTWVVFNSLKPPADPEAVIYSLIVASDAEARAAVLRELQESIARLAGASAR
jgi:hypothetical protein